MVFNGLGYGILPSILIEEYPQLYSIPLVHKNGSKLERKTWLIYKKDKWREETKIYAKTKLYGNDTNE